MKTHFFLFAICFVFIFASCSNNDDGNVFDMVSLAGTWELTSATVALPVDLNMDGNASTNLLEELSCFDNEIVVNNDNTYAQSVTEINAEIVPGIPPVVTAICTGNLLMVTGVWSLEGDQLTFEPEGEESTTVPITLTETTLSFTDTLEDLGQIDLVFTRQ